jgi:hypothetical protein
VERLDLSPVGASAFLVLLAYIVVFLAVMTVRSHLRATREIGGFAYLPLEERWPASKPWVHRTALRYAIGFLVFAWGTLAIGLAETGADFVRQSPGLFVVWTLSPAGIYGIAHLYWYVWVRVGVPPSTSPNR